MTVAVHVITSDAALQKALTARLERSPRLVLTNEDGQLDPVNRTGIVVTPASECEVERCAKLAAHGLTVIILAAIPRPFEQERYLRAGASAYIPMAIDSEQLLAEIYREIDQVDGKAARVGGSNVHHAESMNADPMD
jgi:hypothetical protein